MRRNHRAALLSISTLSALLGSSQVQAADAGSAPPAEPSAVLETVTVTAQKREEKLQDVPIAVTAMNKAQLDARGIENVADLSALAPGLQVSRSPSNDSISQIAIRGNSEINPAIYWDPAVGIYIDGVYLGKSQGTVFDVVDLQRVEVLRGPQGTLYGRNTIGGAINLVTRAPTGEWGGELSTEVGNYGAWVRKASVDLPAFGIAKLSFAARAEDRDGWVKTTPGSSTPDLNDRNNNGFRGAADIAFTPELLLAVRYDRSAINQHGTFGQLYRVDPAGAFDPSQPGNALYPAFASFVSQDRQKTASVEAPQFQRVVVQGGSATLSYQLGDRDTLKSISAHRKLKNDDAGDYDGSPLSIAQTERLTTFEQTSQELQWVGSRGLFNYVGGLYYYQDNGDTNNPQSYFYGGLAFDSRYGTHTKARAVYGQLDYHPLDPLTLTAGLRYTSEKKSLDRAFGVVGAPLLIPEGTNPSKTFDAFTPTVSAAWKFSPQLSTYARYAEGFKSGGFNGEYSNVDFTRPPAEVSAENVAETNTPFKPEKLKSFELGAKTNFLGGRAQVNAAIFHNKLDNYQASVFTATGAAASVIRNAGKATVQGAELEAVVQPIKALRLQANYAWLDPKYDEFMDAGTDQADNRAFVHAPRNTFNIVADARLAQLSFGELRFLADYAYTSSYYTYPYQLSGPGQAGYNPAAPVAGDTKVNGYGLLNGRLALTKIRVGKAMSGELSLWVRNALDEDEPTNFIDFGPGFGDLTQSYFMDPRTYGATATLRW